MISLIAHTPSQCRLVNLVLASFNQGPVIKQWKIEIIYRGNNTFVNRKCTDYLWKLRSPYLYIWKNKLSSESFHTPFEDILILLFLERFYLEKCKFSLLKLNKEKTKRIRDVTKPLYDICKVDIYKDFLKLYYVIINICQLTQAGRHKISVNWHKRGVVKSL